MLGPLQWNMPKITKSDAKLTEKRVVLFSGQCNFRFLSTQVLPGIFWYCSDVCKLWLDIYWLLYCKFTAECDGKSDTSSRTRCIWCVLVLRFDFVGLVQSDWHCPATWTKSPNTTVDNSRPIRKIYSVDKCKQACINNPSCTGIDFKMASGILGWKFDFAYLLKEGKCSITGPWSGQRRNGESPGVMHFELTRNCPTGQKRRRYVASNKNGQWSCRMNQSKLSSFYRDRMFYGSRIIKL